MSEKITLQDIIELLAEKHGMTKKDAEIFVKGMFELIEEALATEKYVKVKGLGTFKLTEVESRESVHINTGERIEIQGHTKISFTPDTTMKDLINKPFAHFETVILNENTELEDTETEIEGEEAEEKEDNVGEAIEEIVITDEIEASHPEENLIQTETEIIAEVEEEITPSISEEVMLTMEESESAKEEADVTLETEKIIVSTPEEDTVNSSFMTDEPISATAEIAKNIEIGNEIEVEIENEIENVSSEEALISTEAEATATANENNMFPIFETSDETDQKEETVQENETGPIAINKELEEPEEAKVFPAELNDKKTRTSWKIIAAVFLVLALACVLYWWLSSKKNQLSEEVDRITTEIKPAATTSVEEADSLVQIQKNDKAKAGAEGSAESEKVITRETLQQAPPVSVAASSGNKEIAKVTLADTVEYDIIGTKTNYTLQEGESLIKVAVKFYGSKKLWPYIVKHNKSIIKDADKVPIGTTLRIPELAPKK